MLVDALRHTFPKVRKITLLELFADRLNHKFLHAIERGKGTRFSFEWTVDSAYRPVVTQSGEDTNQTYVKAV